MGLYQRLLAAAAATPRHEVCGLLLGTPDRIEQAIPADNVADDPRVGFEVDPAVLIAAHRAERGGGPQIVGLYHSHPNGSAEPSAADRAAAEPGRLWLIFAGSGARLWRSHDRGFDPVRLLFA